MQELSVVDLLRPCVIGPAISCMRSYDIATYAELLPIEKALLQAVPCRQEMQNGLAAP